MRKRGFILGVLRILSLTRAIPLDTGRYVIDSRPLHFVDDPDNESRIHNSTIVLRRKGDGFGPVYYNEEKKTDNVINNHYAPEDDNHYVFKDHNPYASQEEPVVWRGPVSPTFEAISNHKGTPRWKRPNSQYTSHLPNWTMGPVYYFNKSSSHYKPTSGIAESTTVSTNFLTGQGYYRPTAEVINNHNSQHKKPPTQQFPSFATTVFGNRNATTDILGDRVKEPDTIKSTAIKVLDAPSHLKTTIKYNKIIVIQKRGDGSSNSSVEPQQLQNFEETEKATKPPGMGNFSVSPVMDPWSNIPLPSRPSWASQPVKGSGLTTKPAASPVVPNLPFMPPFLSSLITPLLNRPLTPNAVNSGMQGIKAMQGFLRNSLMGAMFCFLPSAFIALSLSATQRAELRKMPEIDNMMVFCKKCLENLKEMKDLIQDEQPS